MSAIQKTPLYDFHVSNGANMVDFAGYSMPLTYFGLKEEHQQVRTSGGIFDVSHMGRVEFSGRHARKLVETLCTRKIYDMAIGQCRYGLVLNETGGVKDDVIVYKLDDDKFLMVVNASNRLKLLPHFEAVREKNNFSCKISDETDATAMVALQGPKIVDLIGKYSREIPALKRYRFAVKNLLIVKLIVSRTGYTGEDGVEVILPKAAVGMALKYLLQDVDLKDASAVIRPAGLGARDTLRTEAGMPLYGHELGEEINALQCGVDFAISMDKDQDDRGCTFVGMDALKATIASGGTKHVLTGLTIDGPRSARQGMKIMNGTTEVGVVTSGCPSPTLGKCIAMGFVDRAHNAIGTALTIDTGRGTLNASVCAMPFYKKA